MYVMNMSKKPEYYLHLVEFAYNNNYLTSNKMSPIEVLYGCKCTTPNSWDESTNMAMLGPNILKEMVDIVLTVEQNLKQAHDRQKIYAYLKRTPREFQV